MSLEIDNRALVFQKTSALLLISSDMYQSVFAVKVIVTMVFKRCELKKVTMYDVLYVPKLACNLFSVRAAAAKGMTLGIGYRIGMEICLAQVLLDCETVNLESKKGVHCIRIPSQQKG